MTTKSKITPQQIENWAGSSADRNLFLNLLVEIANGEYKPEQFANDVAAYAEENADD